MTVFVRHRRKHVQSADLTFSLAATQPYPEGAHRHATESPARWSALTRALSLLDCPLTESLGRILLAQGIQADASTVEEGSYLSCRLLTVDPLLRFSSSAAALAFCVIEIHSRYILHRRRFREASERAFAKLRLTWRWK